VAITTDDVVARTKSKDSQQVLQDDIDLADVLLTAYIDDEIVQAAIPVKVYDAAHLAVAIDLYNQRKARNGVANQQYEVADGRIAVPVPETRVSRDPLASAYPILSNFVSPVRFA
jgi:hypothetical protein